MRLNGKWKPTSFIVGLLLSVQILTGCQGVKSFADSADHQLLPVKPVPEQQRKIELLNETADSMYNKFKKGDWEGGRAVLQQLSDQVPQISFEGVTSMEGLHALTETITQGKKVFNAVRFSPEEGQVSAARIRLATDALTHAAEPMWLQYYKVLQEDMDQTEQSAKTAKKADLQKAVSQLEAHISIIHPSLLISRDPTDVEKLDSLVVFISGQTQSEAEPYKQVLNILPSLRLTIDYLFHKKAATAYLPLIDDQNPILWTMVISSVILAVLAYAGWRLVRKDSGIVPIRKQAEDSDN
jgi:sporulation protein YpjB